MLEMPFIVIFTVSSSVQSFPNAVRATRPIIALIAALVSSQRDGSPVGSCSLSTELDTASMAAYTGARDDGIAYDEDGSFVGAYH